MQTLNQMSDAELLAWANGLRRDTFTITLGKRLGNPVTVTESYGEFPPIAFERILRHGGQRKFNDDTNGEKTVETKLEAVREMLRRFKNGEVGRTRGDAPDPFMVIVLRIVRKMVKAQDPAKYKAEMAGDKPDDYFRGVLSRIEANKPDVFKDIMDEAHAERKRQEAEAKGLAKLSVTIDL